MPTPPVPTIDSPIHYRLPDKPDAPNVEQWRPARVVKVWNATCVNLVVTCDGPGDVYANGPSAPAQVWKGSVCEGDGVGDWRYAPPPS